ncbi:MAG: C40 family peptidase [Actinomycetaceae bacterium]|nr:C40 family peptidase [Actinomycetaceae bacterium]
MGLAEVQSRIASIEQKIASLNNNGVPPVALTESSSASAAGFSSQLAAQVASALGVSSTGDTVSDSSTYPQGSSEAFVQQVRKYMGVPYVWGGTDPDKGLDCSGLVQTAAQKIGVTVPRVTWDQQNFGEEIPSVESARPGDIFITRAGAHVVVYVGNGKVIHAPKPGEVVQEASVEDIGPIKTIRRLMPNASEVQARGGVSTSNTLASQMSVAQATQLLSAMSGTQGLGASSSAVNGLGTGTSSNLTSSGLPLANLSNLSLAGAF